MDDEAEFLTSLERSLVNGARHNVARMRRRRRVVVAGASLSLLALGSVGVMAVQGDDGSSDSLGTSPTLSHPASSATPSASTQPDRAPTSTSPIPTSVSTTTTTTTTATSTTSSTNAATPSTNIAITLSTPPGLPCDPAQSIHNDQFPLRRCDRSWGVWWVRTALVARGHLVETDDASMSTDIFADHVEDAVRRFQQSNGLEVDGLVGPQTWFALYPEFLDPSGDLAEFDIDRNGRIEPNEVAAMGDANSQCDVPTADDCPTTTAEP